MHAACRLASCIASKQERLWTTNPEPFISDY
jgi:hypothetical protein